MAQKNDRMKEMLRFLITGGVCFLIEFAVLVFLRSTLGLDTLIATPIAFLVSVAVNYLLCLKWVFHTGEAQNGAVGAGFLVTSLIGLLLNELFMLLFRMTLGEDQVILTLVGFTVNMYMLNKALSTVLVMIWNYFTKKAILTSDFLKRLFGKR